MDLMIRPVIAASVVASLLFGGILFGVDTYVPLFMQGVRGATPRQAGQALTPLFLAWAISVAFAARAVVRWGFRRAGMLGAGLVAVGMIGLVAGAMFRPGAGVRSPWRSSIVGTGMGPASLSFILAVQHAVSWGQHGVATGAVIFFRTIGGAIGVGILGGALGLELGHLLIAAGATGIDVGTALRPETHHLLSPGRPGPRPGQARRSLRDALHSDARPRAGHAASARPGCRASRGRPRRCDRHVDGRDRCRSGPGLPPKSR